MLSRLRSCPRSPPIRAAATAFLLAILTVLAGIGVWAGLRAWPAAAYLGSTADTAPGRPMPMPEREPALGPLPRVRQSVEASFTTRSSPRTASVEIALRETASLDGLTVSILDPDSGATLAKQPLPATEAPLVFTGLPHGELFAVLHESDRSPRFGWLARVVLEPATDAGLRRAKLSAARHDVTIRLLATVLPASGRWVPLQVALARVADPQWGDGALAPIETAFGPGSSDVEVRFPALGEGRYELRFRGFTPESGETLEFAVPGAQLVEVRGAPR